jgi:single stranded DNA-binding protein
MSDFNMVILTGNLVDEPPLRFTNSGAGVCSFRIAHTKRIFNRDTNEWTDGKKLFINVNAWRQFAENIVGSLKKGTPVIVTGELSMRTYDNSEGQKVTVFEIEASEVAPQLSRAEFRRIKKGMTPDEVRDIVGYRGKAAGRFGKTRFRTYDMMAFWRWSLVIHKDGNVRSKRWNVEHD